MNKIHSKVWNKELGQLVVASEFASSDSAGVVHGAGTSTVLRRTLLAAVVAPLLALAGFGSTALAQEWTVTDGTSPAVIDDGGSVTFQGDNNISVEQTGSAGAAVLEVTLEPDLVVDSVRTGNTLMDTDGVAVGANVMLGSTGLVITGGPSVTTAGINAGNSVITGVAAGVNATEAVNVGQLDAVMATASAGWDISAEGGTAANVGSGGSVDFSGDGNVEVTRSGTDLSFRLRYFQTSSTGNDAVALGAESVAIGPDSIAQGDSSFAAGQGAATSETADGAVALGQGATAGTAGDLVEDGEGSVAIGRDSQASGNSTVALGDGANVDSEYVEEATALGAGARVTGAGSNRATAVGAGAHASADAASALGAGAEASGSGSIAVGQARATAGSALAAGAGAYAGSQRGIALGSGAGIGTEGTAGGDRTDHIAIGTNAGQQVVGNQTTAIGYGAGHGVIGDDNVALGTEAGRGLQGNNNISIGLLANDGAGARAQAVAIGDNSAAGSNSVALGSGARAVGNETLALGKDAFAGANGVAVGAHATAEGENVALGRNSAARESDLAGSGYLTGTPAPGSAVSVGNSSPGQAFQRRITNVAAGAQEFDAVNVAQLQAAQRSVATLVGGGVSLDGDGNYGPITVFDTNGDPHQFATIVDAIGAVSSGTIDATTLPPDVVRYLADNRIVNVAAGVDATDAVNVEQLNEAITESGVKYFSANSTIGANRNNSGATGEDAMAIGPEAVAGGDSSLAAGHVAVVDDDAHGAVALGYQVNAKAQNSTVLGNSGAAAYGEGGVAIGQQAVSRGVNSIVMGTGAEADPKSGQTVDNAIVIGTDAEATADDGIAVGQSALASEDRAVAQGHDAHAMATDSQAFGTSALSTGVNSQASGTRAQASGADSIATGTDALGLAANGVAIGSNAVAGFNPNPGEETRNVNAVAIGNSAQAVEEDALAVGRQAQASAQDATAIGRQAAASGENALAAGTGANASAVGASAFGQGAQASHARSVALGAGAVTAGAQGTAGVTIDGISYAYAGINPQATVSVGAPGDERTITNVAAGRVNADSTDAINGSQLFRTNQSVEALADNLDMAGGSIASVLGGNASYDPVTHQVTMANVGGTGEDTVHEAIAYAAQGWDVSAEGGAAANVAPGGTVDFSSSDGNIDITRTGASTNLDFALADEVAVNTSVTVGGAIANTSIGAGVVSVTGGAGTVVIDGGTGTIGGLTNTTFDPGNFTSGQAATEDQLALLSGMVNAGWNVSVGGEGAVAGNNVGPDGVVDFSNDDGNIDITRSGTDLVFDLAGDITVDSVTADSVTAGDTAIDTTGVAVGADVHLGNSGLVITGGPSVTMGGIDAGSLVINNVAAGEISATSTDAINGSQLFGMGDSMATVIGGNATLNPDGTLATSNIGGTGHDNIDDAIRAANDAANAGWTATDAAGNGASIGPGGAVSFTGDGNIGVVQTGSDDSGAIEITLNRDLDVDSITAGNTVIDTDGVQVGDDVHLGDTGLVIDGGPSVTVDGIDAGGSAITNVADGVNDSDAVNMGQLNQVSGAVVDLGDRMDVVEGDVSDLQAGAAGPFQVSQEAPVVAPTPTGANSAAGGSGADASGDNSTALGNQAVASGEGSTAVGQGAQATHGNSVALGQGSATTVGAQAGYDAAYVGSSSSAGEVNVGHRTISGVAPGVAGTDAVNVSQLNAGVNHAVVTANEYTDQRINQVQGDVWNLHGRVDDLEKSINSGVATAMAMRQAPYVAGATTYFAGFGAYKDQGALGVSLRRTADNGRWSLEGGFSANRDGAGGYLGVSGVLGGN